MMKKQIVLRGVLGIPVGITIGCLITIVVSLGWGQGYYSPCVPELADMMGNEINAVVLQTLLCALLGAAFGACSVIWEIESWSIVKQTGIYFLIISVVMLPTAYFLYWMEHSVAGLLSYFGIFAGIFIVIWLTQYLIVMRKVKKLNAKITKKREE